MKRKPTKLRNMLPFEQLESRQMLTVVPELLADIRDGQTGSKLVGDFTEHNGELFFTADNGTSGKELWKTDGTTEGTMQVKDINAGLANSFPGWFTSYKDELYFSAGDTSAGFELWKTDGTSDGTQRVVDIYQGTDDAFPTDVVVFKDELIFAAYSDAGDEIWRSNGVPSGTAQISDINPGTSGSSPASVSGFFEFNGHLYFNAEGDLGVELYRTDGESVELVFDADGGNDDSWPEAFTAFNGDLFFLAETPNDGVDYDSFLYRVDGETGDAAVVFEKSVDLREGLIVVGDKLFFSAEDEERGSELYVSDGTTAGTKLVREIMPGEEGSNPRSFVELDGKLYFAAGDSLVEGTNRVVHQLWSTDGTLFNTKKVGEAQLDPAVPFVEYQNELYYRAYEPETGFELYRSDGTITGTGIVADVFPGENNSLAYPQIVFEDQLLFLADDGEKGMEIWSWDGATTELAEVHQGVGGITSEPELFSFTRFGNDLVFAGSSPFYGDEVFAIRGSEVQVERLPGDADGNGAVEFADFLTLSSNFGKADAVWEDGDFDGSGDVAFADFLILSENFGATLPADVAPESAGEANGQTTAKLNGVSNQSTSSTLLAIDRAFADLDED